jgi:trigger factor
MRNQIADKLLKKNKFQMPPSLVTKQAEYLAARQEDRLTRQGFPKDDAKKLIANMQADIKKQAEKEIRLQYIIETLAENEKIDVTEEEISAKIKEVLDTTEPKAKAATEELLRGRYLPTFRLELRDNKVYDWLEKNAKIIAAETGGFK